MQKRSLARIKSSVKQSTMEIDVGPPRVEAAEDVRAAADATVRKLAGDHPYHIALDQITHITREEYKTAPLGAWSERVQPGELNRRAPVIIGG